MLYNIITVRLRTSKKCDNRVSEINIRSDNTGITSGNRFSIMPLFWSVFGSNAGKCGPE